MWRMSGTNASVAKTSTPALPGRSKTAKLPKDSLACALLLAALLVPGYSNFTALRGISHDQKRA
jgi:hypothetical protein